MDKPSSFDSAYLKSHELSPAEFERLQESIAQDPGNVTQRVTAASYETHPRRLHSRNTPPEHLTWLIQNEGNNGELSSLFGRAKSCTGRVWSELQSAWLEALGRFEHDPALLGNAASFFGHHDCERALECLWKAKALEPENHHWAIQLAHTLRTSVRLARGQQADVDQVHAQALALYEEGLALCSDPEERSSFLLDAAQVALTCDRPELAEAWGREVLEFSASGEPDWNTGNLIYKSHSILGRAALLRGDAEVAGEHLLAAGETPGSPQLNSFGPNFELAEELFDAGQEAVVLRFLERIGRLSTSVSRRTDYWTFQIQAGTRPSFSRFDP